ncbi:MAG: hypothetical protein HYW49_05355 [Deltaproteobacteria bacterium]|nr:hypothetical protein [Deltaproteobacteria bacterium]
MSSKPAILRFQFTGKPTALALKTGLFCLLFSLLPLSAVAKQPQGPLRISESGWYDARLPVPVLHVEGSIEDVARDHGKLVKLYEKQDGRATLDYFSSILERHLRAYPLAIRFPWLGDLFLWLERRFVSEPMVDHLPDDYEAAFKAMAAEVGFSEQQMWDALTVPDAALWLLSLSSSPEKGPDLPTSFGCTSVIWNTGTDSVLHGRNLDYDGVGYWDRKPLILHVVPKEGLAHVAVTSLGVHATGITAFNEAGLTLAVHQLTTEDTQTAGTPVTVISAEVIRGARGINEAVSIISHFPRTAGWAYVLSQGRDRAVVETTASELAVRRSSDPFFFQTNHVGTPPLAKKQIFRGTGNWIDTFERGERLAAFSALNEAARATPEKMARILGDRTRAPVAGAREPFVEAVAGGTIAKLDNIQSVIFDASRRRLWVAVGSPTQAPNESRYVEYRWSDLRSPARPVLTGNTVRAPGPENALRRLLRQVNIRRAQAGSGDEAAAELRETRKKLLTEYVTRAAAAAANQTRWPGLYLYVWSEMKNRALTKAEPKDAAELLNILDVALADADLARDTAYARHRKSIGLLTRARLLDLTGDREAAIATYRLTEATAPFEQTRKSAKSGLGNAYTWKGARKLGIDWAVIDLHSI